MQNNQTIIRIKHLAKLLGISRSSIYNFQNPQSKYFQPHFPKPIALSIRAKGWLRTDIDLYLKEASDDAKRRQNQ